MPSIITYAKCEYREQYEEITYCTDNSFFCKYRSYDQAFFNDDTNNFCRYERASHLEEMLTSFSRGGVSLRKEADLSRVVKKEEDDKK